MEVVFFILIGSVLIELIASIPAYLFVPAFFRIGIRIKKTRVSSININQFDIGKVYTTKSTRFKRVNENSCLFHHRIKFFKLYTPFPISGEILQNKAETFLIWRIPISTTFFFIIWITGWLAPLFNIWQLQWNEIFSKEFAFWLLAECLGIFMFLLMCAISVQVEDKRARDMFTELLMYSVSQNVSSHG
jgi:hypothetical protein